MQQTHENKVLAGGSHSQLIWEMIKSFFQWAERTKLRSYEWGDIWGTEFGSRAKNLYLRNKISGKFLIIPIIFLDLVYPNFRKFFVEKRSFALCHAHFGMAYLNLFEITKQQEYLQKAESFVAPLINMASSQPPGLGWGINVKWTTSEGVIPPNAPCNTQTAYVYSFFKQLHHLKGNKIYIEYLRRIAKHVAYGFPEWRKGDCLISAYHSGFNATRNGVTNANSYRAMMLIDAGKSFNNHGYMEKGIATLRYVLSMQKEDGSWPYSEDQPFVDHYHTCFVIKNLYKANKILSDSTLGIENSIQRGLTYYFSHLFDENGYPVPFAVKPRITLHKYDCYDIAESIGLLADLNIEHRQIVHLCHFAKKKFQTKDGWFIFRRYTFPLLKGIPYMRHANSAMFLALTKVLKLEEVIQHDSAN